MPAHQAIVTAGRGDVQREMSSRLPPPDRQMILNLSVLAPRERVTELGELVAGFQTEGVDVRFTGPWPLYSFVQPRQADPGPFADASE